MGFSWTSPEFANLSCLWTIIFIFYSCHQLNGHEFEQTPGGSEGQGSPHTAVHGVAESDITEQLNNDNNNLIYLSFVPPPQQECKFHVDRDFVSCTLYCMARIWPAQWIPNRVVEEIKWKTHKTPEKHRAYNKNYVNICYYFIFVLNSIQT